MNYKHNSAQNIHLLDFITIECDMVDLDEMNEHSTIKQDEHNIVKRHQFGSLFSFKGIKENLLLTNKGKISRKFSDDQAYIESAISDQWFDSLSNESVEETVEIIFNKRISTINSSDNYIPSEVIMKSLLK